MFEYEVAPGPVVAISVQGPIDVDDRSIRKPVSLNELSVHARLIWLEETAVAASPVGAIGIVAAVVALETFE